MSEYTKTILRDVGLLLHVPGIMALISLVISAILGEYYAIWAFLATAVVAIACGQLLRISFRKAKKGRFPQALLTVAIAWGLISLVGAIPFLIVAWHFTQLPTPPLTIVNFLDPWNAIFESFSGFSSTGLSMAINPSELPRSLQWWRSFTEWIGGVGIIVLVLSVLEPSSDADQLYTAEGRDQKIALTVTKTVREIWKIYLFYTVLSILLLTVAGMPWWEALNHALTGIATGGFSVRDDSIGAYGIVIQLATILVMILGSISFSVHAHLFSKRKLSVFWEDPQHKALWLLLGLGIFVLVWENYWFKGSLLWIDSVFQWVSALGTCGFSTVDLRQWTASDKLLLTLAMFVGGASGSTVGGIKLKRLVALFKGILWRFQRIALKPHQLGRYVLGDRVLTNAEANRWVEGAAVLAALWLAWILIGVFILLHVVDLNRYDLIDVIFEVTSALGSVGLSTGIANPDLPAIGKIILTILMWMGRLEIIPVLFLFSWLFHRLK